MTKGLHEAVISEPKTCDLCDDDTEAQYDARVKGKNVWGYMCDTHFQEMGAGLGTGDGQKLVTRADEG